MDRTTVLLTGATGFIGSHTADELLRRGLRVRCPVRKGRKNAGWLEGLPVEIVEADFSRVESFSHLVDGITHVIHVAGVTKAKRKEEYSRGNVRITENLLEASARAKDLKKFCFLSSLTAVGPSDNGVPVDETSPCHPITAYGKSKLEAELTCRRFSDSVPLVVLRPPTVYGPRDRDLFEMFRWVRYGIRPRIGSQDKTLSLIHVSDLVRAIVDSTLSEKTTGETYFVADPTIYSFDSLIGIISSLEHRRTVPVPFPKPFLIGLAGLVEFVSFFGPRPAILSLDKARDLTQAHWVCSADKIRKAIGFTASISANEGLSTTLEWYKGNGWL